jgi:transposase
MVIAPTRSPKLTVMGAIANRGANAFKQLDGAQNGSTFNRWLREDFGPHLRPGDRVVMDKLGAHKVGGVVEALAAVGASPLCLSPYSPELNSIELVWASSNREVRAIAPRARKALKKIVDGLGATVPTNLCQRWIAHCGHADTQHECGPPSEVLMPAEPSATPGSGDHGETRPVAKVVERRGDRRSTRTE